VNVRKSMVKKGMPTILSVGKSDKSSEMKRRSVKQVCSSSGSLCTRNGLESGFQWVSP
jgi:hypothetical protein